ncbi:S49 family peptidase [Candidatus Tachikawaea gelatinosa]|uniref:Signal peptide peptidase SppA domain protein n=1 Tax=Candidatus Tachikawaea gelatinosa TaxID=1410383 RepID=A0A090BWM6_9ENTR|nr:S49 family peptidase [Candidatus Tachikawaea gelatinosa]BAP58871.1 signal peptide peptidase SppA domain protein [Candidatus Tachikawaea gelatinosa]
MIEKKNIFWERELVQKILFSLHREQMKERKLKIILKILRISFFIAIASFFIFKFSSVRKHLNFQNKPSPHVAYINIQDEISSGTLSDTDHIVPCIKNAFDNPYVKAIILRINSPGGSPVQSGRIYSAIQFEKKLHPEKKIYSVIDEMGLSGAYYIASITDKIYADNASLIGSIGVISSSFGFSSFMEKIGVERRSITAGKNKDFLDPFLPLNKNSEIFWKKVLDNTHQQFIYAVKKGRGKRLKNDSDLFSGLIWNGEQAKKIGLIDGIGSIESVARDEIKETNLVDYSPEIGVLHEIGHRIKMQIIKNIHQLMSIKIF